MNNQFDIKGKKVKLSIETMRQIYIAYKEFILEDYWGDFLRKDGKELTKKEKDKFFSELNDRLEDDDYLNTEISGAEREYVKEMCESQNLEIVD